MNHPDALAPLVSATPGSDIAAAGSGTPPRTPGASVPPESVARLLAAPYRYNLFQAISLLERAAARADKQTVALGVGDGRGEGIRFSAHIALHFPAADIRDVRALPYAPRPTSIRAAAYRLSTPVMSLAGSQGPLPLPFTEWILQRSAARDFATADFLDIFHHRFLSFLYRSRKKHTASLHRAPLQDAPLWRSAAALANLGDLIAMPQPGSIVMPDVVPPRQPLSAAAHANGASESTLRPWLQHAGLLGAAPRSMTGLLALLHDRLKVPFTGRQFIGAWQTLDQDAPPTLGRPIGSRDVAGSAARAFSQQTAMRLDGQCALGQRFWDQAAGIELTCALRDRATYDAFLPAGKTHALIVWLVRRYLQAPTDVHLVLRFIPRTTLVPRLCADAPMRLGWSSWLSHRTEVTAELPAARLTLREGSYA